MRSLLKNAAQSYQKTGRKPRAIDFELVTDGMKPVLQIQTTPNSEARRLEQDLQRQFAERRRQNMTRIGLRPNPVASAKGPKPVAESASIPDNDGIVNQKDVRLGRKERLRLKKLRVLATKTPSSKPTTTIATAQVSSTGKGDKETPPFDGEKPKDKKSASKARKQPPPKTDPPKAGPDTRKGDDDLSKLHSNVRKLKEALEVQGKPNRTSKPKPTSPQPFPRIEDVLRIVSKGKQNAAQTSTASSASKEESARPVDKSVIRKHTSDSKSGKHPAATAETIQQSSTATAKIRRLQSSPIGTPRPPPRAVRKLPVAPSLRAPPQTTSRKNMAIEAVSAADLEITALNVAQPPVRNLSYGLERVLFNPGVYHLQDPRSRVYNFDPYLQKIMPVAEFDFNALKAYVTSSGDEFLNTIAQTHGKRYTGSSSSMTGILAHFHFLLSQWREIQTNMLSNEFPTKSSVKTFTVIQRAPSAVFLRWKNGSYAIDADKQFASANILMMLGKSMEKLLTLSKDEFERYRKSCPDEVPPEERNAPESYHYSTIGDFLMRSQLDAHDPRLPGTGMFDLKTRAVVAVRMDAKQYEQGMGYEIKTRHGAWESYEREYFDMIRAAFLKYSLQVRMGRMDGIFVAFHNTQRIFGFQYISSAEMDAALHGQWDTSLGDQEFKLSLDLLNKVLDRAIKKYPGTSLRIHFETRDAQTPFMYVFAEPVTEEQIDELQSQNDAEIEKFERNILGLGEGDAEAEELQSDDSKWADMQANVEEEMEYDEASLTAPDAEDSMPENEEGEGRLEQQSFEALNNGPLWANARSEGADEDSITPSIGDQHVQDEDADEDELDNATEEHRGSLLEQEGESEDIGQEQFEGSGGSSEGFGDQSTEVVQDLDGDVDSVEVIAEIVEEEMSYTQDGADIQLEAGSAEGVEGVEEVDGIDDPEAAVPQALAHTVIASESGELKIESQGSPSQPETPITAEENFDTQADAPFLDTVAEETLPPTAAQEVLAMTLTIRNKVNDRYVIRPENLSSSDQWVVEYVLAEVDRPDKAWSLYQASQTRRRKQLDKADDDDDKTVEWYIRNLRELSRKGEEWRKQQDELDKARPKVVLGQPLPEIQPQEQGEAEPKP